MKFGFISLTSDFGVQTQGVGLMEATARAIAPQAVCVHLMHGLPAYDVVAAARTLESVSYLPVGVHVCVCDPGVGSSRKAIAIEVVRGDILIGPDNGVLIPATRILGGIRRAVEIVNPTYMRQPVSKIFHGRDIFVPTAAYLCNGVALDEFGPPLSGEDLAPASYKEASIHDGLIDCKVIQINRFGSVHLNILHAMWDEYVGVGPTTVLLQSASISDLHLTVAETFSDVPRGAALILKDDYGRVEMALNSGSFVESYPLQIGQRITLKLVQNSF